MNNRIRVFLVEDYQIMRDGIKSLLLQDPDIDVVGEAADGADLIKQLETVEVDVLVLDLYLDAMEDMKTMNGFQISQFVQDTYPHIRILAHSIYDDGDRLAAILKAGATGFVSKKSGYDELIRGIKIVHAGKQFICARTAGRLKNLTQFLLGIETNLKSKEELFTFREREVLNLLSEGKSSKEVAETLFITERTVESHRRNMIDKGRVKNTVELIAYAGSLGILKK